MDNFSPALIFMTDVVVFEEQNFSVVLMFC